MKRILPALFIILASLALAQPAQAPSVAEIANSLDDQAEIAINTAAQFGAYPVPQYYFLGRAAGLRSAADYLRTKGAVSQ